MKKILLLVAVLAIGCAANNSPNSPSSPTATPTPTTTGKIVFTWSETVSTHGCTMVWTLNGANPVTVTTDPGAGSASVTLWNNVSFGTYTAGLDIGFGVHSNPITVTGSKQTIHMSDTCTLPNTSFYVSYP